MTDKIPYLLQSKKKLKVKKQSQELTKADLQRLKALLQENLTCLQDLSINVKWHIQNAWKQAEEGSQEGRAWFDVMNADKNYLRELNKKIKNLEQTQKRIKSMLSS